MAYETIKYEVDEQILTITLNRPDKLNAFNGTMQQELIEAFDAADKDDNIRAIIVTGAGRGFCAGADLSSGANTFDRDARRGTGQAASTTAVSTIAILRSATAAARSRLRIFKCLKPVIAAVNGPAVGIGVTMQLAMDIRIASEARGSASCSPSAASCRKPPRAGSCRASSASRRRWSGVIRAASSRRRRRSPAASSARWCRRTICCRPRARSRREITEKTAPVSVALIRQMMWRMLGADDPMEAHKVDSRGIYARGAPGTSRKA